MLPVLLRVGPVTIYSFGVFLSLAVLLASFLVWKQARKKGLPEEKVFDTFILTIFVAIIFARLGYVFSHWEVFGADPSRIFLFNHYAGLSFPWGFAGGLVAAMVSSHILELESLLILDYFALAFSWAVTVGWAGCFLDGCLVGAPKYLLPAMLVIFAAIAALLLALNYKINASPKLVDLARRPGLFMSSYLIFFLSSFLILGEATGSAEKVIYLAIIAVSGIVFMVKFPASVLKQIKTYLEEKHRDAEHRLHDLKKEDPFADNSRLLDRASEDTEAAAKAGHERVAAMQQQLNLVMVSTRKALTKIKIGKYGICEGCGKMIDTDRLAAMPTATLCLSCEKKRER
ncbi:prolipoprotein diacylglyceryl transferase [Patescibacteria group bacterium]|nr:prolipoprotein diacylglyceryl transferase [Patescibacteria group bacterium]